LHKAYNQLSELEKDDFHTHLTLLDIHPTALARDLLVLVLLDELMSAEKSELELEVTKATIFYTTAAAIMPPICYAKYVYLFLFWLGGSDGFLGSRKLSDTFSKYFNLILSQSSLIGSTSFHPLFPV
jgi:hypothetical protein